MSMEMIRRQLVLFNTRDEEMTRRHSRCQLALLNVLIREDFNFPRPLGFWGMFDSVKFACVPECTSLAQVYGIEDKIAWQRVVCDSKNITLFKIPRFVNDVESYVTMLLFKHREEL